MFSKVFTKQVSSPKIKGNPQKARELVISLMKFPEAQPPLRTYNELYKNSRNFLLIQATLRGFIKLIRRSINFLNVSKFQI